MSDPVKAIASKIGPPHDFLQRLVQVLAGCPSFDVESAAVDWTRKRMRQAGLTEEVSSLGRGEILEIYRATSGQVHPIRAARMRAGITQADLASDLNVTQAALSHIEHGRRLHTSFATIATIADALGVNRRELVGDMLEFALTM